MAGGEGSAMSDISYLSSVCPSWAEQLTAPLYSTLGPECDTLVDYYLCEDRGEGS